jgi:hypothetical protein
MSREIQDLTLKFGDLTALNRVGLKADDRELRGHRRPKRRRQDRAVELHQRRLSTARRPHAARRTGITAIPADIGERSGNGHPRQSTDASGLADASGPAPSVAYKSGYWRLEANYSKGIRRQHRIIWRASSR